MDAGKIKYVSVVIFVIWVSLWINFIARDLIKKGYARDYLVLATKSAEDKRAYTYGEHFYEFLKFAKYIIPSNAKYRFANSANPSGGDPSLDYRRGIYYLYPLVVGEDPEYILAYKTKGYEEEGFSLYAGFDDDSFILMRKR